MLCIIIKWREAWEKKVEKISKKLALNFSQSKTTPQKIIAVNGNKLLDLMIEFSVGTEVSTTFETYKIDEDYFSE